MPDLFVIASVAKEAVTRPAKNELGVLLLVFALCATLGMAAARWVGNKTLVAPTRRLLDDINELAGSDAALAGRSGKSVDEMQALSGAFQHLASILKLRQAERDSHEAELQLAQERLLTAQRIGKIGNWEFDAATRRFWWSDQVYALCEQEPGCFAVTLESMTGQIFPEDRERCLQARRHFSAGHARLDIEYRIVTRTGQVRWVHDLGEKRVDDQGRAVMSGTVQDITEQARNERLLAAEARALKALSLGLPLTAVLEETLLGLQSILPGAITCVHLLSPDGSRLQAGAAPPLTGVSWWWRQTLNLTPCGPTAGRWLCNTACAPAGRCPCWTLQAACWRPLRFTTVSLHHPARKIWRWSIARPMWSVLP